MTEYIYLLQLYPNNPDQIYKIGRSSRPFYDRLAEYKHTKPTIKLVLSCEKSKINENELLRKFRSQFTERKDMGNEYFMGNVEEMKKVIICHLYPAQNIGIDDTKILPDDYRRLPMTTEEFELCLFNVTFPIKFEDNERHSYYEYAHNLDQFKYDYHYIHMSFEKIEEKCDKHMSAENYTCPLGHVICGQCYRDQNKCCYCVCYDINNQCQNKHSNKMSHANMDLYKKCVDLNLVYGSNLRTCEEYEKCENVSRMEQSYLSINEWYVSMVDESITPLYAECLRSSMMIMKPQTIDTYGGILYEKLPPCVKIWLLSSPIERKREWLSELNHCYARLLINMSHGKHLHLCVGLGKGTYDDQRKEICGCIGDDYIVWIMYHLANIIFAEYISEPTVKMSVVDAHKFSKFQTGIFSSDVEDFFTYLPWKDTSSWEEYIVKWASTYVNDKYDSMIFNTPPVLPCEWFVKYV